MEKTLILEQVVLLTASIVLIYLASRLNMGLRRSIYLIFAWLSTVMLSTLVILVLIADGLAPEEIILSVYCFSVLLGLSIHFLVNSKRKQNVNLSTLYRLKSNLN